jgi:hypothetical protein
MTCQDFFSSVRGEERERERLEFPPPLLHGVNYCISCGRAADTHGAEVAHKTVGLLGLPVVNSFA